MNNSMTLDLQLDPDLDLPVGDHVPEVAAAPEDDGLDGGHQVEVGEDVAAAVGDVVGVEDAGEGGALLGVGRRLSAGGLAQRKTA